MITVDATYLARSNIVNLAQTLSLFSCLQVEDHPSCSTDEQLVIVDDLPPLVPSSSNSEHFFHGFCVKWQLQTVKNRFSEAKSVRFCDWNWNDLNDWF